MVRPVYACRIFPDVSFLVRNRSKEIVELLSDVEKIRTERRKAKANKPKYTGVGNDGWNSASSGSRYGGFGSDSFASNGGGSYGNYDGDDDGGYSGGGSRSGGDGGYSGSSYSGGGHSRRFQEYDAGDDETPRRSSLSTNDARSSNQKGKSASPQSTAPSKAPEKAPAKEVDLLGFVDDDAFDSGSAIPPPINAPVLAPPRPTQPAVSLDGMHYFATAILTQTDRSFVDDDFNDFQAAPPPTTNSGFTAPAPQPSRPVIPLQPLQQARPTVPFQPAQQFQPIQPVQPVQQPNLFGSGMNVMSPGSRTTSPPYAAPNYNISTSIMSSPTQRGGTTKPTTSSTPANSGTSANFDDLWNISLGGTPMAKKPNTNPAPAKSMKDLEKEKAAAGIWGATNQNQARQPTMGGGLWGSSNATASNMNTIKPSGGVDDLLF